MWFFIGFIVAAQVGGAMLDRSGAKLPMIIGCILSAVGYGMWAFKTTDLSAGAVTPYIVLAGAGIGFLLGPASTDAVNRSINASYGEVTGITQTVRNYGSAVGMAILGSIMASIFSRDIVPSLLGLGVTRDQANLLTQSYAGGGTSASGVIANYPPGIADKIQSVAQLDFARSLQAVFYAMAAIMIVALICALLHPGGKVELETGVAQQDEEETPPKLKPLIIKMVIFVGIFAAIYLVVDLFTNW
jgi:MFS family permease